MQNQMAVMLSVIDLLAQANGPMVKRRKKYDDENVNNIEQVLASVLQTTVHTVYCTGYAANGQ